MTLQCNPKGLCSYDYLITGDSFHATTTNKAARKGSITYEGLEYSITREGFFNDRWLLIGPSGTVATATKKSVFSSTYDLTFENLEFSLKQSFMSRAMNLTGLSTDITIEPVHTFTRRAVISGKSSAHILTLFAFWVTTLTWQRQTANSSAGVSAN